MSKTKWRNGFVFVAAMCLGLIVTSGRGGSLDDTGAPTDPASAMYTAKDIYNRLAFGTNAPKRTGAFTEPTAGPTAGTMPTTDEIMAKAPATNASGAAVGEVVSGKTFWGLTQGAWGTRTGTIATVTLSATTTNMAAGYYAATNLAQVATNLAAENIVSNIGIFGVTGTAITATGDAAAADVLATKTFSKAGASGLTGTMTNLGAVTITPTNAAQAILQGYHSGAGSVAGDADLVTGNIRATVNIFGVAGSNAVVDTTVATATTNDLLSGKTAWVQGAAVTGTIETVTLSGTTTNMAAGYYAATNLAQVATNLAAGNIKTNVTIFGIAGTLSTNTGSAYPALVPKTGQTNSYANYDDGWYSTNKGVAWPNPRFTTNGVAADSNCVTDHLTGLMWLKNPDATTYTWSDAITHCEELNGLDGRGGYTDWRLPNRRELESLLDLGQDDPGAWLLTQGFIGVQSGATTYWSSTTRKGLVGHAWDVYMGIGDVVGGDKTLAKWVWPVRGGQ